jgi:hypothetical protein
VVSLKFSLLCAREGVTDITRMRFWEADQWKSVLELGEIYNLPQREVLSLSYLNLQNIN